MADALKISSTETLINRSRRTLNIKNRVDGATEDTVIDYAIADLVQGQHPISNEFSKKGIFVLEVVFAQSGSCII